MTTLRSFIDRYSLAAILRSPDDPAVDPPADAPAPDNALSDAPADAPAGDPAPEPAPAPAQQPPKWALGRISEETSKRQAAEARAEAAERRANEALALAERLQQSGDNPPAPRPAPAPAPQGDYQADVQRGVTLAKLQDDANDVRSTGFTSFPDFGDTINVVGSIFSDHTNDFLQDLFAVDKANAHVILDQLAKSPERAASLAAMDPRRRTAELTRMSMAAAPKPAPAPAPAPPKVSQAPKPAPALAPAGGDTVENDGLGDEIDDDTWSRNWDKQNRRSA